MSIGELTAFEHLPIPGGVFELDGTIAMLNAAACRLVGRAHDQLVGCKLWELSPSLEHVWQNLVAAGELAIESTFGAHEVEFVLSVREHDGRRVVLGCATDITKYKHAEIAAQASAAQERRQAASKRLEALGLVAGSLAHEFNNLLTSVVAEAGILREEAHNDATRDAIARIETSARRMTHLTSQLLSYTGRGRFVTKLVDPEALLDEKRETFARKLPVGAKIEVVPGAGEVAVVADRGLLRQIIRELVENAAEALPEDRDGHIKIASRVVDEDRRAFWQLEVSDDGCGMDQATQARIFDPFFTTKEQHRGLGLSAVLGIVGRLGGEITLRSTAGAGTTFRVRLPIVPGVAPPRRRTTSEQPPVLALAGLRILVADDEPTVRSTVTRLLERRGAIPVLANDGEQAKHLLRTQTFDLVLLDVLMPKLTGYELIPVARATQINVPVILMSGYSEPSHATAAPDAFIEKPFTATTLETAIRNVFAGEPQARPGSED